MSHSLALRERREIITVNPHLLYRQNYTRWDIWNIIYERKQSIGNFDVPDWATPQNDT